MLKKLFNMYGVEKLRDIQAGKPTVDGDWLTRMRFVAADLEDLDLHPLGRRYNGADALAEIKELRKLSKPGNEAGPSFSGASLT